MNQINDLPGDSTFGLEFDYTRWNGKTSQATLYQVPWSSDYRDITVKSHTDLHTFLDTLPKLTRFGFSHLKYNQPVKIDVPMNEALKYNYLVVWNPEQPISGDQHRYLYYFINDVLYDSPGSTKLVLQLDAVQTFLREVRFGQAYVEQGHAAIAESTVEIGSQGILTQPEGLNLGADYVIKAQKRQVIAEPNGGFGVMVVSTVDLAGEAGTVDDPKFLTATGSDFEGLPNGTNLYIFNGATEFKAYVASMKEKPWVTQGIVSITAFPVIFVNPAWPKVNLNGINVYAPTQTSKVEIIPYTLMPNFRDTMLPSTLRHRHLKKFTVYPYSFAELTTYAGEPLVLKPELWGSEDATVVVRAHIAPPSPRIGVRPLSYNTEIPMPAGTPDELLDARDMGELWNVALWLTNLPQFAIVNNGYLQTMASQAHGIQQSYKDAGWQQQKALSGNALAYDQQTAGMNLANDMTQNSVNSMAQQTSLANTTTGLRAGANSVMAVGGAAQNIVGGAGVGAAAGAGLNIMGNVMNAAIDINQQSQGSAIQQRLANQQNQAQVGNQGFVRDTNKNYADFATKGDYQNTINTIGAKVEDAKMTQPTTAGTGGGDAFNLATNGWQIVMNIKTVPKGAALAIGDYWLRYGYAINRFMPMPLNYQCMDTFTYWKLKESYIISAQCPEPIKQALRGIFEKGVTVWHKPELMGQPTAMIVNTPLYANYIPE